MMGRRRRDQGRLFYEFHLEDRIPEHHLLRRINVFVTVALEAAAPSGAHGTQEQRDGVEPASPVVRLLPQEKSTRSGNEGDCERPRVPLGLDDFVADGIANQRGRG